MGWGPYRGSWKGLRPASCLQGAPPERGRWWNRCTGGIQHIMELWFHIHGVELSLERLERPGSGVSIGLQWGRRGKWWLGFWVWRVKWKIRQLWVKGSRSFRPARGQEDIAEQIKWELSWWAWGFVVDRTCGRVVDRFLLTHFKSVDRVALDLDWLVGCCGTAAFGGSAEVWAECCSWQQHPGACE